MNVIRHQLEVNSHLTAKEIQQGNPYLLASVSLKNCNITSTMTCSTSLASCYLDQSWQNIIGERHIFAKKYKERDVIKWHSVLASDETMFYVTGNLSGRVYRLRGIDPIDPKYTRGAVKHPDTVMVLGCFHIMSLVTSYAFLKMWLWTRTITCSSCVTTYQTFDKCRADLFYAKQCTLSHCQGWGCDSVAHKLWHSLLQWYPIENLWGILKWKLWQADTSSVTQMKAAIRKEWEEVTLILQKILLSSLSRHLDEWIKHNGMSPH